MFGRSSDTAKKFNRELVGKSSKRRDVLYGDVKSVLCERVRQHLGITYLRDRDKDDMGWNLGELAYYVWTKYSENIRKLDYTEAAQFIADLRGLGPVSDVTKMKVAFSMDTAFREVGIGKLVERFIATGMEGVVAGSVVPGGGGAGVPGGAARGVAMTADEVKVVDAFVFSINKQAVERELRTHLKHHGNTKLKGYNHAEGLSWTLLDLTNIMLAEACTRAGGLGRCPDFYRLAHYWATSKYSQAAPDKLVLAKVANVMGDACGKYAIHAFVESLKKNISAYTFKLRTTVVTKAAGAAAAASSGGPSRSNPSHLSSPGSAADAGVMGEVAPAKLLKSLEPRLREHLLVQQVSKIMTYNVAEFGWTLLDLAAYAFIQKAKNQPVRFTKAAIEVAEKKYGILDPEPQKLSKVIAAMSQAYKKLQIGEFVDDRLAKRQARVAAAAERKSQGGEEDADESASRQQQKAASRPAGAGGGAGVKRPRAAVEHDGPTSQQDDGSQPRRRFGQGIGRKEGEGGAAAAPAAARERPAGGAARQSRCEWDDVEEYGGGRSTAAAAGVGGRHDHR